MARDGEEKRRRLPFFATGEIAGDYGPLYAYWEEAGSRAAEAVLSSEDFQALRRLLAGGEPRRLDQVLEELSHRFRSRVDPAAAARALRRYYGVDFDEQTAAERIARLLAAWLVEAAGEWGMLRLRRSWERRSPGEEKGEEG